MNIKEIRKPELDAYLVAENVAQQLEKRIAYRKAMKRAMQSTLRLGAKGIKITVAGRLAGTEIARTEWLREGSIPLHTLRADVDYGEAEAETTARKSCFRGLEVPLESIHDYPFPSLGSPRNRYRLGPLFD